MLKAVVFVICFAAAPVFADPPVDSYRLEVAGADAAAVAAFALGSHNDTVIELSIATYALAAPIIHAAHGRYRTAVGSLILRVGLPALGGALGFAAGTGLFAPFLGMLFGAVVGAGTASVIDVGVLARGDDTPRIMPAVTPTASRGMTFGIAGRF